MFMAGGKFGDDDTNHPYSAMQLDTVLPMMPMWGGATCRFSLVRLWCGGYTEVGRCLRSSRNGVRYLW